ncbi:hypothetical protein IMG5_008380, partial [Ichthyophthirius multifiliis]
GFPEGTTTNGKYLISFKKGAFETFAPIKIFCLQYPVRRFNVSLDSLGQGACFLLTFAQFYNQINVIEFENYYPDHLELDPKSECDWQVYASAIKQIMIKATGFKNSESGYRDMSFYYNFIKSNKTNRKNETIEKDETNGKNETNQNKIDEKQKNE